MQKQIKGIRQSQAEYLLLYNENHAIVAWFSLYNKTPTVFPWVFRVNQYPSSSSTRITLTLSFFLWRAITVKFTQILPSELQPLGIFPPVTSEMHLPVFAQGVSQLSLLQLSGAAMVLTRITASSRSLTILFVPATKITFLGP